MPAELVAFNPADWSDDPGDPLQWYYFGRFRWTDARNAWLAGSAPLSKIQNPQTRPEGQRQHGPDPRKAPEG
ncbi:hypothetical protein GCM10009730_42250 [Streptomyces albidochromogenes]